jgi:hypothetical protein
MDSREKGKRGEREARDHVREHWSSPNCIRAAQSNGKHSADLLEAGKDLHVEVKRIASIGAMAFLAQAERDRKLGEIPVVLMKHNNGFQGQGRKMSGWVVAFPIEDTSKFIESILANKNSINEIRSNLGLIPDD